MKFIGTIIIAVAIYFWWAARGDKKRIRNAVSLLALGLLVFNIGYGKQAKQQRAAESSSKREASISKAQSKKDDKSISDDEKVDKLKVKNTCNALNEEMSQHQELQGFKLKPSTGGGDSFIAEVPDTVTAMSDNEQQSVYRSLVKLIYSYDNGTNEGTLVEFEDSTGTPVARSSYTGSGEVKLEK